VSSRRDGRLSELSKLSSATSFLLCIRARLQSCHPRSNGQGFSPCHREICTKFQSKKAQGLKALREISPLSPVGTSESSPGRSPGLGMRHQAVPKGRLKIRTLCSAVPRGTVELAYHYPGLCPGLLSDVSARLSAVSSRADSKAPVFCALTARLIATARKLCAGFEGWCWRWSRAFLSMAGYEFNSLSFLPTAPGPKLM
jgi:hypothetical protein